MLNLKAYSALKKSLIPLRFLRRSRLIRRLYVGLENKIVSYGVILIGCHGIRFFVDSADLGLGRKLLNQERFEAYETSLFEHFVKKGMTIVDVGANIGYYSLLAATILDGTGKVIAFEPVPRNYDLFLKSMDENGFKNILPIQKALSNRNGSQEISLDAKDYSTSSLSEKNTPQPLTSLQVETTTLDICLKEQRVSRVDVLKIDVEGAETLVLEGATETLKHTRLLLLEFWPPAIRNLHGDPFCCLLELQKSFSIKRIDEVKKQLVNLRELKDLRQLASLDCCMNLLLESRDIQ